MQATDIEDVLNVQSILAPIWTDDAPPLAETIAALIEWADGRGAVIRAPKSTAKRGKATESVDSEPAFEPSTDPSEPEF